MRENATIIYCESKFPGIEHAPGNAAFIAAVLLAYPGARMICFGGQAQLEVIQQILREAGNKSFEAVEWIGLDLFVSRKRYFAEQFPNDLRWLFYFFNRIKAIRPDLVILGTTSSMVLFLLKFFLPIKSKKTAWIVVLHAELCEVDIRGSRRPWYLLTRVGKVLDYPQPSNMKLVLLGESIRRSLLQIKPKLAGEKIYSIERTYFWSTKSGQPPCGVPQARIVFGFTGGIYAGRGFGLYEKLAKKMEGLAGKAVFETVGFAAAPAYSGSYFTDLPRQPLSPDVYKKKISEITYSVLLGEYSLYRLAASGSFLDALSFVKPVIALKNPYVEYYFKKLGDIGYLCDSYEDLERVVAGIINNFSPERYVLQCGNIIANRDLFSPEKVSARVREIFEA
jgi:hypothetical protein